MFTGKTCEGKAIFVIAGNDVTVRGITFMPCRRGRPQRRRHPRRGRQSDGRRQPLHRQRGGHPRRRAPPRTTIRIIHSEFRGNGNCEAQCAHGIYVGAIALLDIEDSHFTDTHEGHDIKSRALRTVLRGNDISDGPTGHASYLVDICRTAATC